ncbi:MAG TPA: hypothetical protein VJT32_03180 [bacterium]|nr:hypothetical protein [bacterium]
MHGKRILGFAAAAGIAVVLATSGVFAQTTPPPSYQRGELGSSRNLQRVDTGLSRLIDQLEGDQHDYDGYRVKAIAEMRQAKADLDQALQWDATHRH